MRVSTARNVRMLHSASTDPLYGWTSPKNDELSAAVDSSYRSCCCAQKTTTETKNATADRGRRLSSRLTADLHARTAGARWLDEVLRSRGPLDYLLSLHLGHAQICPKGL
uniref:Uncharacterized protein n=1 Tax=Steinernema glaseri TaxID=37863 RepID=A0A1I7YZF6_9BILA